jgi:hypothetical protein
MQLRKGSRYQSRIMVQTTIFETVNIIEPFDHPDIVGTPDQTSGVGGYFVNLQTP